MEGNPALWNNFNKDLNNKIKPSTVHFIYLFFKKPFFIFHPPVEVNKQPMIIKLWKWDAKTGEGGREMIHCS